ncbi:MAG: flagellar basal-body rod protein FlgF [Oligoflexia bacterium]|nr:flagellar basal-body rod protein FlgF [Oligoflexia bacterium]
MKDIWVPLSAALAHQKSVDIIANNVANINTPGFKKDQMVFKEYLTIFNRGADNIDAPEKEWGQGDSYRSYGAENGFVVSNGTYTVFQQGQLTPTGNPLDLAIFGQGFFEVLTPNGVRFSRRGILSLGTNGDLVTEQGFKVLSKKTEAEVPTSAEVGAPPPAAVSSVEEAKARVINLGANPRQVTVSQQGEVFVSGKSVGTLSMVEFTDVHSLRKEGDSLFINGDEKNIKRDQLKSVIHQGMIEGSNVDAVTEMSDLIKANRNFESLQRVLKTYDAVAGRGVNDISKF